MTGRCNLDECPERHCIVDNRHLADDEAQTCIGCLGRARGDLVVICECYALLPAELVDAGGVSFEPIPSGSGEPPMPGGDVLVMLADGNVGGGDPNIESPADPVPPVALLASWEDDIRKLRGFKAAGAATMTTCSSFLDRNLSWAAQEHPAFDELAFDLRRLRRRLEAVTKAGDALDRGGRIPCPECETPLVRHYRDPRPCQHESAAPCGCDQGGRTDDWQCPNRGCGRVVTDREYGFALWAYLIDLEKSGRTA